jgi:diaminohydroxyphosphoribosylaminopyrimidine deaminase/5-amino-6-(5-phosphoribosylamino)uracil reductase
MDSRLAQTAREDVLVFTESTHTPRKNELERLGIKVVQVRQSNENALDLSAVLKHLGGMEITSLLVEGGSHINASLLNSGLVDKIFFFFAPRILGDFGVPFATGLNRRMNLKHSQLHQFGDDFAIEGYLRGPYSD